MYLELSERLKARLLHAAMHTDAHGIDSLESRPLFFLAPQSHLGLVHGPAIAAAAKGLVAVVDDKSTQAAIHGVPRWTSERFLRDAKSYKNAVALDFSMSHGARAMFSALCAQAGIERQDCVVAQAQLGLISVYESASEYRSKTLARLDQLMRLAERFADQHSRATLYANLLFRITYDRSPMLSTWANPSDEYFANFAHSSTFTLGKNEHYCDCGAFQGPVVSKFLGATEYRYASITAFEPDRTNFEMLQKVSPVPLVNFRSVNKAVSDRAGHLRFMETGSISSHASDQGNTQVDTIKLDDEVDKLTFLKMDIEGFEVNALKGASRLLRENKPRVAACVYHYADDLLDVVEQLEQAVDNYNYRLRQHNGSYYYDLILYASTESGAEPGPVAA